MCSVHLSFLSQPAEQPSALRTGHPARVVELVDAPDSKSGSRKGVRVRIPPRAPL